MLREFHPFIRSAPYFLVGLGVYILLGWAIASEPMIRVVPGSTAMAINTAVMFLLCGLCLLLPQPGKAPFKKARGLFSAILIGLPILILFQHVSRIDIGIDWASVHAALGDGHAKPGRTAPNACLGFLFAGIVFSLTNRGWLGPNTYRAALALAVITFFIGITAFVGFVLNLEVLYQVASLNKMAALTALGITVVGIGIWSEAARHRPKLTEKIDRGARIASLAAALLTVFALVTGLMAFGVLKNSYEKSAGANIQATATTSALSVSTILDKVILLSRSISTRPWDPLESTCRHASLSIL